MATIAAACLERHEFCIKSGVPDHRILILFWSLRTMVLCTFTCILTNREHKIGWCSKKNRVFAFVFDLLCSQVKSIISTRFIIRGRLENGRASFHIIIWSSSGNLPKNGNVDSPVESPAEPPAESTTASMDVTVIGLLLVGKFWDISMQTYELSQELIYSHVFALAAPWYWQQQHWCSIKSGLRLYKCQSHFACFDICGRRCTKRASIPGCQISSKQHGRHWSLNHWHTCQRFNIIKSTLISKRVQKNSAAQSFFHLCNTAQYYIGQFPPKYLMQQINSKRVQRISLHNRSFHLCNIAQ